MVCGHKHTEKILFDQCRLMTAILGKNWGIKKKKSLVNRDMENGKVIL